jgi:hypothetical protein
MDNQWKVDSKLADNPAVRVFTRKSSKRQPPVEVRGYQAAIAI